MFSMKCSRVDISHAVDVVSGHMENPEHWKWVLWYLSRGTSITYSGCGDLVYGYNSGYLDKKIPSSDYVSQECKDLLGKIGQV